MSLPKDAPDRLALARAKLDAEKRRPALRQALFLDADDE